MKRVVCLGTLTLAGGFAMASANEARQEQSPLVVDPQNARDLLGMQHTSHLDWAKSKDWAAGLEGLV